MIDIFNGDITETVFALLYYGLRACQHFTSSALAQELVSYETTALSTTQNSIFFAYGFRFGLLRQVATPTVSKMAYYYEPGDYELKKGWFPFRNNHFLVNSEKVGLHYAGTDTPVLMLRAWR